MKQSLNTPVIHGFSRTAWRVKAMGFTFSAFYSIGS